MLFQRVQTEKEETIRGRKYSPKFKRFRWIKGLSQYPLVLTAIWCQWLPFSNVFRKTKLPDENLFFFFKSIQSTISITDMKVMTPLIVMTPLSV